MKQKWAKCINKASKKKGAGASYDATWEEGKLYAYCPVLCGYQVCTIPNKTWDEVTFEEVGVFLDDAFANHFELVC